MRITFNFIFIFITTILFGQESSRKLSVDSGIVYVNFHSGGTTALISIYSAQLDTMTRMMQKPFSKPYLDTLTTILSNIKSTRHFQQKLGPTNYAKVYINGEPHRLAFFNKWAIIDLTNKPYKQIVIANTRYEEIYRRFILNNWL